MLPEIELVADVDVVAMSPLVRGMVMAVSYADTEGGIGLTASGAMNRKFVHTSMGGLFRVGIRHPSRDHRLLRHMQKSSRLIVFIGMSHLEIECTLLHSMSKLFKDETK
jgi:hypothetical protein